MTNLFADLPNALPEELVSVLVENGGVRIERIVSNGQHSPQGFWYDQDEAEWVVVLQGEALLQFKDRPSVRMKPGDFIDIPAHQKHRVEWTIPGQPTVWLAVFYGAPIRSA